MSRYRKGYEALGEALRKRAATELDHEAAELEAESIVVHQPDTGNLARCYQARGERIARLEALVRSLGACPGCEGLGERFELNLKCSDCAGTGLVEAARKELENG